MKNLFLVIPLIFTISSCGVKNGKRTNTEKNPNGNNDQLDSQIVVDFCERPNTIIRLIEVESGRSCEHVEYGDLKKVTSLSISNDVNLKLKAEHFKGFTNLTHLDINGVNIGIFNNSLFFHLNNLESISFSNCQFKSLPNNIFNKKKKLKSISINSNDIKEITSDIFNKLESLESLNLNANNIEYISPKAFIGLTNLKVLHLGFNKIKEFDHKVFIKPSKLHTLSLVNNSITTISRTSLESLNFEHPFFRLYLDENPLNIDTQRIIKDFNFIEFQK